MTRIEIFAKKLYSDRFLDSLIWVMTTCMFASFFILNSSYLNSFVLIALTGFSAFFMVIRLKKLPFEIRGFHILFLLFILYCGLSSLWAWDSTLSLTRTFTLIQIFVCLFVFYAYYYKTKNYIALIKALMWAGTVVSTYTLIHYSMASILRALTYNYRLASTFININSLGIVAAISVCIIVFFLITEKIFARLLMLVPNIIVIAFISSRTAFMILVAGIILLLCLKSINKNVKKSILRLIIIFLSLVLLLYILSKTHLFSGLITRLLNAGLALLGIGSDVSADFRLMFIDIGLEQFKKTPIFGIGMGNSHVLLKEVYHEDTYLHNNFVELLCNGGIIGFAIYYSFYAYYFIKILFTAKVKTPYKLIFLILPVLIILLDFTDVNYYQKSTYFYFLTMYVFADVMILEKKEHFTKNLFQKKKTKGKNE